jgi:hypothetical protein
MTIGEPLRNCAFCARDLQPDEPVWRRRIGRSGSYIVTPVCDNCNDRACAGLSRNEVVPASPCEACGRPVHQMERRRTRRHVYCCDQCKANGEAGIARERRATARGSTRPCADCGEHFEPTRADVRFCSGACKQRAYRKRVTLRKATTLRF